MCDPATLAVASMAMSVAGTAASAQSQNKMNQANYDSAMTAYRHNDAALQYQNQQAFAATQQEAEEQQRQTLKADAAARVQAGESGIMGNTVDALFREIAGGGARNQSSIYENFLRGSFQTNQQRAGQVQMVNQTVASMPRSSGLAAGLQIAGAGMSAYGGYKSGKFGQDGNQWSAVK
jgi:hypothetical protein